jgi:uncharacterized membrane protein YgcG
MLGAARWILAPVLVAAWLLLPATAHAIVPQVRDNGKFFDADTIAKANAVIKRIEEKYKKDVVVETFAEIPPDVKTKFNYTPETRDAFYHKWRDSLAEQAGVNGIIVIIAKDQGKTHIEVAAGGETLKRDFTPHDVEKLTDILAVGFSKDPNSRLIDGLQYVETTVAAHHQKRGGAAAATPPAQVPSRSTPTRGADADAGGGILGWVCIGLCVLLGIWLVMGIFRAFSGGGRGGYAGGGGPGYAGGGGGYGGGGGGFMSGLFGGLFGAMAGNWIYNSMFGGQSYHQSSWGQSNAYGSGTTTTPQNDAEPSDQGQGFAGSGRDVDDGADGGGGDGGGGDAGGGGGGDWGGGGGGDTGGGGGDWGGGGGDWGGGGDVGGGGGDFGGGGGGGGDW